MSTRERKRLAVVAVAGALLLTITPVHATPDILARMAAVNPDLHTYTATLHAQITLRTFPFLATQIVGTIYRKEPDLEKLVVTSGLPGVADQFSKLYPRIVSPSRWNDLFVVTVTGDDGTTSKLRLVPRKRGNVDHIDATVDDRTALISSMRWNYDNGGYAEMSQQYASIDGNSLPTTQTGHIEEPGYVADITSTVDEYHLNVPLSDSAFEQQ